MGLIHDQSGVTSYKASTTIEGLVVSSILGSTMVPVIDHMVTSIMRVLSLVLSPYDVRRIMMEDDL